MGAHWLIHIKHDLIGDTLTNLANLLVLLVCHCIDLVFFSGRKGSPFIQDIYLISIIASYLTDVVGEYGSVYSQYVFLWSPACHNMTHTLHVKIQILPTKGAFFCCNFCFNLFVGLIDLIASHITDVHGEYDKYE